MSLFCDDDGDEAEGDPFAPCNLSDVSVDPPSMTPGDVYNISNINFIYHFKIIMLGKNVALHECKFVCQASSSSKKNVLAFAPGVVPTPAHSSRGVFSSTSTFKPTTAFSGLHDFFESEEKGSSMEAQLMRLM